METLCLMMIETKCRQEGLKRETEGKRERNTKELERMKASESITLLYMKDSVNALQDKQTDTGTREI